MDILEDILAQPTLLAAALTGHLAADGPLEAAAASLRAARQIVLTGMGSSFFACYPAYLALLDAGMPASWVELSELLHFAPGAIGPDTALVLVSQSGETVEMIRLLERTVRAATVIAVTNAPSSTLARAANHCILSGAGDELTIATKTYSCSLLALSLLAGRAAGRERAALHDAAQRSIDACAAVCDATPAQIDALDALWLAPGPLTIVGRGPSHGTAISAGLLFKETAKIPSEGMSSAAFRHGPLEIAGPGHRAIVVAGPGATFGYDRTLADELRAAGSDTLLLADLPAQRDCIVVPACPLPALPEIVPIQLLARRMAQHLGIAPGTFHRITKVTGVE